MKFHAAAGCACSAARPRSPRSPGSASPSAAPASPSPRSGRGRARRSSAAIAARSSSTTRDGTRRARDGRRREERARVDARRRQAAALAPRTMHPAAPMARHEIGMAECRDAQRSEVNEGDGQRATRVVLCTRGDATPAQRAERLQRARDRLAGDSELSAEQRARVPPPSTARSRGCAGSKPNGRPDRWSKYPAGGGAVGPPPHSALQAPSAPVACRDGAARPQRPAPDRDAAGRRGEPVRVIFDTGASGNVLDADFATPRQLPNHGPAQVGSPAGGPPMIGFRTRIAAGTLGNARLGDVRAVALPFAMQRRRRGVRSRHLLRPAGPCRPRPRRDPGHGEDSGQHAGGRGPSL